MLGIGHSEIAFSNTTAENDFMNETLIIVE